MVLSVGRTCLSLVALLAVAASPVAAPMTVAIATVSSGADVGPGWFSSGNVTLDRNLPVNSGTAGARVVGDQLLVTDHNGLTVWDVSDPAAPTVDGFVAIPQQYYFTEEDVPSNGEIALVGQYGSVSLQLNVVDVSLDDNPAGQPTVIGTLPRVDEHTFECARDCTYAYGSGGAIIDLTDPTTPKDVGEWDDRVREQTDPRTGAKYTFRRPTHDVTEVAPGILLTSSNPMYLLDVRETPTAPKVIGVGSFPDHRFVHANLWPYHGDLPTDPADPAAEGWAPDWAAFDDFVLIGGETSPLGAGGACDRNDGAFMTATWRPLDLDPGDGTHDVDFVELRFDPQNGHGDEYQVERGAFVDGGSPYSLFCTHWFTPRPGYRDGGLLAIAWYEFGVRFLEIGSAGRITEKGWLIPMGGSTSAAYWLDDDTLYTADYQRGVDILTWQDVPASDGVVAREGMRFRRARIEAPADVEALFLRYGCPLPS